MVIINLYQLILAIFVYYIVFLPYLGIGYLIVKYSIWFVLLLPPWYVISEVITSSTLYSNDEEEE